MNTMDFIGRAMRHCQPYEHGTGNEQRQTNPRSLGTIHEPHHPTSRPSETKLIKGIVLRGIIMKKQFDPVKLAHLLRWVLIVQVPMRLIMYMI